MNILFSGLGRMGMPMAKNLTKSSHKIYGFDTNKINLEQAYQNGILKFDPNVKIDIYLSMVPDIKALESFYYSEYGPFNNFNDNSLLIDCSTIGPVQARKIQNICKQKNMNFIDAPVSGGVMGAQNSNLTFMVGSNDENFDRAKSILQFMGTNIKSCGGIGTGQIVKICNNLALGIQMRSISEALKLGEKLGMDGKVLSDIMSASTSQCWSLTKCNPQPKNYDHSPSSNNYNGGFSCELIKKDLQIAIECAKEQNLKLEFGQKCFESYQDLVDQGFGDKDFGLIYQYLPQILNENKQLIQKINIKNTTIKKIHSLIINITQILEITYLAGKFRRSSRTDFLGGASHCTIDVCNTQLISKDIQTAQFLFGVFLRNQKQIFSLIIIRILFPFFLQVLQ